MPSRRIRIIPLLLLLAGMALPLRAQDSFQDIIEMRVNAGFDTFFRPGHWTPLRLSVANHGESISGRIVVRPETSGTVVGNAFSTPIDLPAGARKTATLYIQARSFPDSLRLELIDADGNVRATKEAGLNDLALGDQLVAVIRGANSSLPNLSALHIGGGIAELALWQVHELPDQAPALESLDFIVFVNSESEELTAAQHTALRRWLANGGHLILLGGPLAARTTTGFEDILPLDLGESQSVDNLAALARYAGDYGETLAARAIVVSGAAREGAQVLAAQDGMPLLLRRAVGAGALDYLAADPTLEPLASWDKLEWLWKRLLVTREPHPAWTRGITKPEAGAEAVANLPGVDLLPPLQALCLFLAFYILLIGPANYFILTRLNRAGFAWLTIPLVIIAFTVIAWTVGFNLRGAEILVSRLTLVQAHADVDEARVDQLVGLLSPRRATYSLEAPAGHFLAVAGATSPSTIFASNTIQTSTEISQGTRFGAADFTIDGGIFANFAIQGSVPKPAIDGAFALEFDALETGRIVATYRGVVRNDSDITLRDARLLSHGIAYRLERDLAPGDIVAIDGDQLRADNRDFASQPQPLELNAAPPDFGTMTFSTTGGRNATIREIQGERYLRTRAFINAHTAEENQAAREQSFLASFARDVFASSGRGQKLYLIGYADEWARDLEIKGAAWSAIDTTLYIIEMDVERRLPRPQSTLASEHFSWMSRLRDGAAFSGTDNFSMYEQQFVEFLIAPLQGMALDSVQRMLLEVDRSGGYAQSLDILLWDWTAGEFAKFGYREGDELEFVGANPYLGPGNMIWLRLGYEEGMGTARVRKIRIEQTGLWE